MKAILINSKEKTITEVEVDGRKDILTQWYKLIGCNLVETAVYLDAPDDKGSTDSILVDEEGMITGQPKYFFSYQGGHQPFAGNGLVVGCDDVGNTIGCSATVEQIAEKVLFYSLNEVRELLQDSND